MMASVWRIGHERDILNHAPPTVSVDFWMKRLLYYIQSIRSEKKQAMPSIFLIQYSVSLGSTSQYGSKELFWFTWTLSILKWYSG